MQAGAQRFFSIIRVTIIIERCAKPEPSSCDVFIPVRVHGKCNLIIASRFYDCISEFRGRIITVCRQRIQLVCSGIVRIISGIPRCHCGGIHHALFGRCEIAGRHFLQRIAKFACSVVVWIYLGWVSSIVFTIIPQRCIRLIYLIISLKRKLISRFIFY